MENKQTTRELILNTLTNMGIKYEIDEDDFICFEYQGMEFDALEDKDNDFITLRYIKLEYNGETEDLIRRRRIINKVSKTINVVIYTKYGATFYSRNILFIKEIPEIEDYLRSQLQELKRAYEMVNDALQKELEKEKMSTCQKGYRDEVSAQTKELFIKSILELDYEYEPWKNEDSTLDSILFENGGEKFRATFYDYLREVVIENHYATYSVELSDLKKVKHLCEAINKANHEYNIITTYTIENESNKIYAASHCIIPFMAEMPQLLSYLRSMLDSFYDVKIFIEDEMKEAEEIEKLRDLHQDPN